MAPELRTPAGAPLSCDVRFPATGEDPGTLRAGHLRAPESLANHALLGAQDSSVIPLIRARAKRLARAAGGAPAIVAEYDDGGAEEVAERSDPAQHLTVIVVARAACGYRGTEAGPRLVDWTGEAWRALGGR